jgi:diguanylate cyclase (GGDEF)-like protein/PAS domain S-box-containing protein
MGVSFGSRGAQQLAPSSETSVPTESKPNSFATQWAMFSIGLAILAAATALHLYFERQRVDSREQERLLTQARVIQLNVEANLAAVNEVLTDLRLTLQRQAPSHDMDDALRTLTDAMPGVRTLVVMDGKGNIKASSRPELSGRNFAYRDYFTAPRKQPDSDMLFVSAPFRSTLGVYGVTLSRVIPGPHGEFAGVVVATLDPEYFRTLMASVLYAPDMWTGMAHGDGVLFMLEPNHEGQAGKNLAAPGSLFSRHRDSGKDADVLRGTTSSTGEERMMAMRSIRLAKQKQDKLLVVAAGRRIDAIFEPWRHDVRVQSTFVLVIALLAALALKAHQRRYMTLVRKEADAAAALGSRERFMRILTDNIPGMVGYWDEDLRCGFANKSYLEWFGKTPEQMRGIRIQDLMGEELFRRNEPYMRAVLRGEPQRFERTLVKADGSVGHTWAHYIPDIEQGHVKGFYVLVTDITEVKRMQMALAESEAKLKAIIEAEPECVKVLALDGKVLQMNRAGLDIVEADTEEQVVGRPFGDLLAPEYRAAFDEFNAGVGRGDTASLEFEIVGLKGRRRWVDTRAVPMRDAAGNITGVLGVSRDMTARKKAEQELEQLAQTDFLTGVANRRHFLMLAEQELSRTQRYGGPLSVFMIDVDHFKNVNDTHGHQVGDQVLETLGRVCRQAMRDIDIVGRLGGEEFGVVLPQTDHGAALEAAERLRRAVLDAKVALEHGLPLSITISIGVATLGDPTTNIDTLLSQADQALYAAKDSGRNRTCGYPEAVSAAPGATAK